MALFASFLLSDSVKWIQRASLSSSSFFSSYPFHLFLSSQTFGIITVLKWRSFPLIASSSRNSATPRPFPNTVDDEWRDYRNDSIGRVKSSLHSLSFPSSRTSIYHCFKVYAVQWSLYSVVHLYPQSLRAFIHSSFSYLLDSTEGRGLTE